VIVYKGVMLAALFPMDNADYETVSLGTNPKCIAMLERYRARGRKEGGIPAEEMGKMFEDDKDD